MRRVQLGARDLWVSRLLFGTLTMGPLQRNLPAERGAELICHAARRGINFVDTAEYYRTYPHIRLALKEAPDLVICTKSYAYDREGARRAVEAAQEGAGRERIDVFLMHEQESLHTLRGHEEAFAYYCQLREAGIIGAVGISTHHVAAVRAAAGWPGMDVVFPLINQRGLGIADGTREEMEEAIRLAHEAGLSVLAMKVLGGGHLIQNRREAIAYALNLPGVDAVALGMQSEAEIDYNAALMEGREPPAPAALESAQAQRMLLIQDWCEGCGRCQRRCFQRAITLREGRAVADQEKCLRCGYCAAVCPQFCIKIM